MIKINTVPRRHDGATSIIWNDPVLTIDSVDHDLSELTDGDSAVWEVENKLIYLDRVGDDYTAKVTVNFNPADEERTTIDPIEFVVSEDGVVL